MTLKIGLALGMWLALGLACSGNLEKQADVACLPGETRACLGLGQCKGIQVCNADGHSLTSCDCRTESNGAAAGSASAGLSHSAGAGSSGDGPTAQAGSSGAVSGAQAGSSGAMVAAGATSGGVGSMTSSSAGSSVAFSSGGAPGISVAGAPAASFAGSPEVSTNGGQTNTPATAGNGGGLPSTGGLGGTTASGGAANSGAIAGATNTAGSPSSLVKLVSGNPGSFLQHVWSYGFPSVGGSFLSIANDGSIYILGSAPYNYSFGSGSAPYSEQTGLLLKLAANGKHVWDVRFKGNSISYVLAVDGTGRALVQQTAVSYSTDKFTIDTGWLCGAELSGQKFTTSYISALNANGSCAWAYSFVSLYASLTPTGDVVIGTAAVTQRLNWSDRTPTWNNSLGSVLAATAPNNDIIAVSQGTSAQISRLDAATGASIWQKSAGGKLWFESAPYDLRPRTGVIRFRPDGSMIWSDIAEGNTRLWDLAVPAAKWGAPFIIALTTTGDFLWGITAVDSQVRVATSPTGDTVVCGTFKDVVSFMGQELRVPGDITTSDVYMALLGPGGELKKLEQWRLADNQRCHDLSFDPNGDLLVLGGYTGAIDFGGGQLPTEASMYLAKFQLNSTRSADAL